MQPVEGTSLISRADPIHQQVYNYIHQAITSGEFGPGERLVEAQIAARLGISRAPVREAIRRGDGAAGSAIVQQSFLRVYEHLAAYLKAHGLSEDV